MVLGNRTAFSGGAPAKDHRWTDSQVSKAMGMQVGMDVRDLGVGGRQNRVERPP
jgi:hypothetical protein